MFPSAEGHRRFVPFPSDFEVSGDEVSVSVRPYEITKRVNVKERWRDRPLGEVFSENFQLEKNYLEEAALNKKLLINDLECSPEDLLRNGDVVTHTYLMEEPPLRNEKVEVLAENELLLVVDKPEGLPCHPQRSFEKSSLTEIVRRGYLGETWEYLHPINRLDRQTSGIVLLAKSRKGYMLLSKQLHDDAMSKLYVARVAGTLQGCTSGSEISTEEGEASAIDVLAASKRTWHSVCSLPLHLEKHKTGQPLTTVVDHEKGKEATTHFMTLRRFCDGTSLVLCRPITGRTHQIRVHLSALGCPILGDRLYGSQHCVPTPPGAISTELDEDRLCLHAAAYTLSLAKEDDEDEDEDAAKRTDFAELKENLPLQTGFEDAPGSSCSLVYLCHRQPAWCSGKVISKQGAPR